MAAGSARHPCGAGVAPVALLCLGSSKVRGCAVGSFMVRSKDGVRCEHAAQQAGNENRRAAQLGGSRLEIRLQL